MTQAQIDAIEARAAAATPGPWDAIIQHADSGDIDREIWAAHGQIACLDEGGRGPSISSPVALKRDAAFIAAAREDVPALVAEVRRLRDVITKAGLWRGGDV